MRVLVTGSAGHIGRDQVRVLRQAGYEVRTLDRSARRRGDDWEHIPGDLRDLDTVRKAVSGMDAVAHLGAIASDRRGSGDDVLTVNVQGTWNILISSVEAGVERVVSFSSINALGCVGGHRPARQLPIADDYFPHHPMTPYQLSKHLGEECCASFSARHGLITLSLRPGYVAAPEHYIWIRQHASDQTQEGQKIEYWGYVDRRDVCEATRLALEVQGVQNDAFLLFAADTTQTTPSRELVQRFYPDTPWTVDPDTYFADDPCRSLFDCSHAKEVLGWTPKHSWRDTVHAE